MQASHPIFLIFNEVVLFLAVGLEQFQNQHIVFDFIPCSKSSLFPDGDGSHLKLSYSK
uniref:Uncharacterized protein n=1 Tax=Anguilla anguilla TaxID=7936 RepID=A0A0E9RR21_ANGAN